MTIADYVIIGGVLLSGVIGLFRGFFREALSLVSWIAAAYIAFRFGPQAAEQLVEHISTPSVRLAAAYVALFVSVLIAGALINFMVGKLVKSSGLAGTDKTLGLLFGCARGIVILLVFILLAGVTVVSQDPWYRSSQLITYFTPWAEKMREVLPDDVDQYLDAPAAGIPAKPASSDQSSS